MDEIKEPVFNLIGDSEIAKKNADLLNSLFKFEWISSLINNHIIKEQDSGLLLQKSRKVNILEQVIEQLKRIKFQLGIAYFSTLDIQDVLHKKNEEDYLKLQKEREIIKKETKALLEEIEIIKKEKNEALEETKKLKEQFEILKQKLKEKK